MANNDQEPLRLGSLNIFYTGHLGQQQTALSYCIHIVLERKKLNVTVAQSPVLKSPQKVARKQKSLLLLI